MQSQYAAAANVPLIKSPALRVPPPVKLPPDIHPLPDSVTPYFVYPFTLESHVLALESSRRNTIAAHAVRREALLRARDDERQRRKREALRRVAPGIRGKWRGPNARPCSKPTPIMLVTTRLGSSSPPPRDLWMALPTGKVRLARWTIWQTNLPG
ncbi:hypothetical protein F5141DRAFT_1007078 [Pisolithus sp. B1]|nr:hypothetical protein F5141DRAFT_1007078 [Pisolithus sp. B1]